MTGRGLEEWEGSALMWIRRGGKEGGHASGDGINRLFKLDFDR